MLTPFRELLRDARLRGYAVGAFNCLSLENVMGALAAAEELRSPLILQVAEVQFPTAPLELAGALFLQAARTTTVPVAVHLDHGQSPETCIRALRAGFNSVMYDGANLPLEENIARTRLVARLAHAAGVDTEGELGRVGDTGDGGEGGCNVAKGEPGHGSEGTCGGTADGFTDPEEAARFIAETGVDALAVAIGNLHGRYAATPHLNIARLREIDALNGIPLVLHGGSGTSEEDFKACIRSGICKINVATAIQLAVRERLREDKGSGRPLDYIGMKTRIVEATRECVAAHIHLFESAGKA